jgi:hypothetical protein
VTITRYYWVAKSFDGTWSYGYINTSGKVERTIGIAPKRILAKVECKMDALRSGACANITEA